MSPARVRSGDSLVDLARLALAMGPAQLERFARTLDPDDLAVLEQAMALVTDTTWRANPATFAHHLTKGRYKLWRYVVLLAERFRAAIEGTDVRQLWNMPSQMGKTSALMFGALWALDRNPSLRIMYVTYDADKAVKDAGEALDLAREHQGVLRFRLRRDIQARGRWVTADGGGLYATGVGGGITGYPADVVLGDDLIKGWREAHSPTVREHTWNVYRSQMRLRLQSPSDPVILAGTRWHEDDPTGRALAEPAEDVQPWTLVRLPALAEVPDPAAERPELRQPDPLGRALGEPLEPERFPLEEVQARARTLGDYLAAGLEQQRPAPEEGGTFKRAWWRLESALPPAYDEVVTSWDMKLKDNEAGDYVAGVAMGRTGKDVWVTDVLRGQWGFLASQCAVALLAIRHPECRTHWIENTGNGPEVMAELRKARADFELSDELAGQLGMVEDERQAVEALLRRGMPGLVPNNPKGSKEVRAIAHAGTVQAGDVHLPERAPWLGAFLEEMATFPNGRDDQVDAWSQGMSKLVRGGADVQRPERRIGEGGGAVVRLGG